MKGTELKIGHFSDIHAGYASLRKRTSEDINVREADGYRAFEEAVTDAIEQDIDLAVICGDLFHVHNPSIRAIFEVQQQLRRFADADIPVYTLAGNHDVSDIRSDIAASKIIDDPFRKIFSHAEPYIKYEVADGVHLHLVSHHMYGEQKDTMKFIKPVDGEINIFSTHGFIIDPLLQEALHCEKSPREIVIPDFLPEDYDWSYVMLGHIHERGWVGSKNKKKDTENTKIYYNGSIIRRGFSDKEVPLGRGWTLWTIGNDGVFRPEHRTVTQRPQEDFKTIDASAMTAHDITDKILDNLRKARDKSGDLDEWTTPLLRQKISNITPAKYSALDFKAIHSESEFALDFSLSKVLDKKLDLEDEGGDKNKKRDTEDGSVDVLTAYDKWVDGSEAMEKTTEEIKDKVKTKSRDFVVKSQEKELNDE